MKNKILVFDIDGTICNNTFGDYESAKPFDDMVEEINRLYKNNKIIMMTARGSKTGIDWSDFTKAQLESWGVKYHELIMNKKPHAHMYIDDKSINAFSFRLLLSKEEA